MKLSGVLAEKGLTPFIEEEFKVNNRKNPKIWIAVVDAAQAHFFRKPNHHLEKIGHATPKGGSEEHAHEAHGPHDHEKSISHGSEMFLKKVADFLNDAVARKALDRLVLVAAPRALGQLRPLLSKEAHNHINAEMDKDLTHLNEKELYDYLDKAFWA